jgi:succinate dehydrogenase flavin-adding protein (antitoxin of CptAB toxin-antitoxin module)
VGGVMRVVEQSFNTVLDENDRELMRFINHVRNMVFEYIAAPKSNKKQKEDDELYALAMNRQKEVAECCVRVSSFLYDTYGISLAKNDMALLAIHIAKIMDGLGKNDA